ncbi:MAG: transposase [Nanoarchaeota archaeon]|nr:transposase [Nanoarchaeota archaeon]
MTDKQLKINDEFFGRWNKQTTLTKPKEFDFEPIKDLEPNPRALEFEKKNFIEFASAFINSMDFNDEQERGRPRCNLKDVIISLCIMSYNNLSYRRTMSDLMELKSKEIIKQIPKKTSLHKYMNSKYIRSIIEDLIQYTSLFFVDSENTIICDSTWLATRMYTGGYKTVYCRKYPLEGSRKLHLSILKNSKVISCAKASEGNAHDSPFFKYLVGTTFKNGFKLSTILADSGYQSVESHKFCGVLGIKNVFIDFRKNVKLTGNKGIVWRKSLRLFREHPKIWKETYRYRVLIESVNSAIKRKQKNYLRMKNETAQDVELLLMALVYNFTIVCKYI